MALLELAPSGKGFALGLDTEKALRAPIGAVSPLWLAFAGAASAGVAFWWMSRWMRPANLEAFLFTAPAAEPVVEPVAEAVAELTASEPEPAEIIAEAVVVEIEPTFEAAAEFVLEAAPEPEPAEIIAEAVVVEIEPAPEAAAEFVLEAAPAEPVPEPVKAKPAPRAAPAAKPAAPRSAKTPRTPSAKTPS